MYVWLTPTEALEAVESIEGVPLSVSKGVLSLAIEIEFAIRVGLNGHSVVLDNIYALNHFQKLINDTVRRFTIKQTCKILRHKFDSMIGS